ncbi:hypothetical protein RF11_11009 [Thelohanellus kitauei]|uniref:Uncharacterized protein n=1 Tax=Thelohanellus kitauei TaxID=669202 RepID=A0A0C2N281_THEKT|nr:hypothetical protein RF11_11009 [Thelohanellus kitauei]
MIISLNLKPGNYKLNDIAMTVTIPHDEICDCLDPTCIRKLVSHPLCNNHFLVYGAQWCILVRIFLKSEDFTFKSGRFSVESQEENESSDDDDDMCVSGKKLNPNPIYGMLLEQEVAEHGRFFFDVALYIFSLSDFKNFVGASFLPYKNRCNEIILIDSVKIITINIRTLKFGPCSYVTLKARDEFDEFIVCEQAYPYVIVQTKFQSFYAVYREKKFIESTFFIFDFGYTDIASALTLPHNKDEYDCFAAAYYKPRNQKRTFFHILHRYRQKITVYLNSAEISEIVDMKYIKTGEKAYFIVHLDNRNFFIAPLMLNFI